MPAVWPAFGGEGAGGEGVLTGNGAVEMATAKKTGLPGGFTVGTFPLYPEQVKRLVESHKKLKEHPLYLAVWYDLDDSSTPA